LERQKKTKKLPLGASVPLPNYFSASMPAWAGLSVPGGWELEPGNTRDGARMIFIDERSGCPPFEPANG